MAEKISVSDLKIILEKVKEAKSTAKKRKFLQTWDLSINLKGIDLKKPENRVNLEFPLPHGRGKQLKIGVFSDLLAADAKVDADIVIRKEEIDGLSRDRKKLKKLASQYDFFLAEAPLMPIIGKSMGIVLAPRGKMPKPFPPKADIKPIIIAAQKTVKIFTKESPAIHVPVGTEEMDDELVAENIDAVIKFARERLPKGKDSISSAYIKLSMGPAVKIMLK